MHDSATEEGAVCFQEAACRRKAVLAYFNEKRHACQCEHELPCDVCQNRQHVVSQLRRLAAVQQANAMAEFNKDRKSTSPLPVKAVWQKNAATSSSDGRMSADKALSSTKVDILQPVKNASQQLAQGREVHTPGKESEICQLAMQQCKRLKRTPDAQEQQRPPNESGAANMPATADCATSTIKAIVKPVIKRLRYNTAFKPPRRV